MPPAGWLFTVIVSFCGPDQTYICWRGRPPSAGVVHVRVVRAARVLGLGADRVSADAPAAVVVELGVAGGLVEARVVEEVVQEVVDVEERRDRGLLLGRVGQRVHGRVVRVVEGTRRREGRAEVAGLRLVAVPAEAVEIGVDVVSHGLRRGGRQPRVRRRVHERIRLQRVERGGDVRRHRAVGVAGGVRCGHVAVRAVARDVHASARRVGPEAVGEGVGDGQVVPVEDPPVRSRR